MIARLKPAAIVALVLTLAAALAAAQDAKKKVFIQTDLEGVSGIFDFQLQCYPGSSPRFEEARKLLAGEVNAAVDGLFAGGATEVVVWDSHDGARTISVMDLDRRVRLLAGIPIPATGEIDSSYDALILVGLHAMAGTEKGILAHTFDFGTSQAFWVNGTPVGEVGFAVMLAGFSGVPAIMAAGDSAACREFARLVPTGEQAPVKTGVSWTAGYMLPHAASCALIREKARRAMERLAEFKPYRISGPVEIKMEYTAAGIRTIRSAEGIEQLGPRTWVFRGKDFMEAWLRLSPWERWLANAKY